MELRHYSSVIWDRRLVVLGVTLASLIAAILSVAALPQPLPSYQAAVTFSVTPTNLPQPSYQQYGEYNLFLASEFLNDDIINMVEGPDLLDALRVHLGN